MDIQVIRRRVGSWDGGLFIVLFAAALTRLAWVGLYQLKWDEVRILTDSLRLARYGEWTWLSNATSWGGLPGHSPFSVYVLSIPYVLTADPRVPRLLVAVMGVAAVGILYVMTKRYFGRGAALIAGLLFATAPTAIEWSSYVWNPNLAQPFIALWALTGLIGYYEGRRWAQIAHWPMLSLAVQAHPGNGLLLPLSGLLLVVGWFRGDRRKLVLHTALSGLVVLLTLIPWIIGVAKAGLSDSGDDLAFEEVQRTFSYIRTTFSTLVSSTEFWTYFRGDGWWPSLKTDKILWVKTWLTLAGVVWLLWEGWRSKWKGFPGVFLALLTLIPLIGFWVSPIDVVDFYLMALMFGAFPVQGIVLAKLAASRRGAWIPVGAAVVVFVGLQSWLVLGAWHWMKTEGTQEAFRAPLVVHLDLMDEWSARAEHIVVLTETLEGKYGATEQTGLWQVVGEAEGIQVVNMPQGIPIDPDGEVLASTYGGTMIPQLFGEGERAGELSNGQPMFRWVYIPPQFTPPLNFIPESSARFDNGAKILGLETLDKPQAGKPWKIILYWQPEKTDIAKQYQFSVRVVD
ncbi:MAG TPA: glycosyltransferase family 39 protein, partial [Aggregatilineaceae bacterium]|nr:glycosyltransferase family 39 protein [Aggregatilineaceae bacterium]